VGGQNSKLWCARGAQRPVWRGNELKKTGARSARARTRGQNTLVYNRQSGDDCMTVAKNIVWYTLFILDPRSRILIFYSSPIPGSTSVADPDPGSGAFLTPWYGIRNRFFPDPGSQIHIFESLVTIFWVQSSIILWKLAQIFFFNTSKLK
jgi:hypothetical protein